MSGVGKVSEKMQVCIKKFKQLYFKDILTDFETAQDKSEVLAKRRTETGLEKEESV